MRKTLWISIALVLVVPGLLFTASCAKKTVKSDAAQEMSQDEATRTAAKSKSTTDEGRLREEALSREKMAARSMFLSEDIYFEFDSATLLRRAQRVLKRKAAWLRDNPDVSSVIEGHCDERGTNEYNLALGDRRAESTKAFLINLGISGSRVSTISYGEERPVDTDHNENAWAKNRRAHFQVE